MSDDSNRENNQTARVAIRFITPALVLMSPVFGYIVHEVMVTVVTAIICGTICFVAWVHGPHREHTRQLGLSGRPVRVKQIPPAPVKAGIAQRRTVPGVVIESRRTPHGELQSHRLDL